MADVSRAALDEVTRQVNAISKEAAALLRSVLDALDWSDVATAREALIEAYDMIASVNADLAAQVGADFYDAVRIIEVGEPLGVTVGGTYDRTATERAIHALVDGAANGNVGKTERAVLDRLDTEVRRSANVAVERMGARDARKLRFARVPSGSETCDFCLMLASRGFVYATKETASHAHGGCDCRIVPSFGKGSGVEGYDPHEVAGRWTDAVNEKAAARAERNGTDEATERRRIMRGYEESAARAKARRAKGYTG